MNPSLFLVFNRTLKFSVKTANQDEAFQTLNLFWFEWEHDAELVEMEPISGAVIGRVHHWPMGMAA